MSTGKPSGKTTHQLLFSEAISQPHTMASSHAPNGSGPNYASVSTRPGITMDHILQEITVVGLRLEVMDFKIMDLARMIEFDHHLTDVEGRLNGMPDRDQELQLLRNKLTDREDRSGRYKVCFFGIPEREEATDVRASLRDFLPGLKGLVFSLTLEFQRAHRIAPPPPPQRHPWETVPHHSVLP
ncbi:hypothetical protein NDU88_004636 [Pleurodeles waltl]|uniref:Uncharacterized protein n=1 Tax=Pleurodeles waltl TaxID=8319 RepID=A0AAV7L0V2_PLEWA|nr:hypothetical protein NDU88_004636 [Pleurodeles waltl]